MTSLLRGITGIAGLILTAFPIMAADITTLAGKKLSGEVVRLDATSVVVKEATGEVTVPIKELAAIDFSPRRSIPASEKYDLVELTDGSQLPVTKLGIKAKRVELQFLSGAPPVSDVALTQLFMLTRGANDPKNVDDWKRLLANRGKRDLFVIRQADGLNPLPGTVIEGNETGERITFEREDGQRSSLPLTRATGGLVFNQPPRDAVPPTLCKVHDTLGNVLFAQAVEIAEGKWTIRTVSGASFTYESSKGLSKLDFAPGNLAYLSDLDLAVTYPPPEKDGPLGEEFPFAPVVVKNRILDGSEIVLGGKKYGRGLSVPSDTSVTIKLDGTFREFYTTAGVPDTVRPENAVLKLRIEVDGRVVLTKSIAKKSAPEAISLNIKDARELKITVEREALFAGNQITLAEARVQK